MSTELVTQGTAAEAWRAIRAGLCGEPVADPAPGTAQAVVQFLGQFIADVMTGSLESRGWAEADARAEVLGYAERTLSYIVLGEGPDGESFLLEPGEDI